MSNGAQKIDGLWPRSEILNRLLGVIPMSSHHHTADAATKYGTGRKTLKSYIIGLGLSLLLTLLAFWLVTNHMANTQSLYVFLAVLAILQLIAQVICFLRLNTTREGKWNTMPFLFTILVIVTLVIGSLWIMFNVNYHMVH